ncbi:MAG: D-Ala-D-Ala carboxypeptidase family metallohydrolase [Azospirillaceae bacterium]|nr:D-Ala-D-Ala carboxypeptidase family metallohydrolase [Azospirillaceae bacterium]
MPDVLYGTHPVSDAALRDLLQKIADILNCQVIVTSGDRMSVPKGGAKNSLHLMGRAADIHVQGMSDSELFLKLRSKRAEIFGASLGTPMAWQILLHGKYTRTEAPHLHIGDPTAQSTAFRGFVEEGTVPGQAYFVVEH